MTKSTSWNLTRIGASHPLVWASHPLESKSHQFQNAPLKSHQGLPAISFVLVLIN
jgi:hypothetical protein